MLPKVRDSRVGPSGFGTGKKVEGKRRHSLVGRLGRLLGAAVHPASVQDRDGAIPLLRAACRRFAFAQVFFADGADWGAAVWLAPATGD